MDKVAPRLGFAYDVKGDGKWKAYGSYGWYYDITTLELPRSSFGGDHWANYYWTLDTAEHELRPTMSVGVRYVHKWLFGTIEDVGVFYQGSEIYLISNPGEGLAVQMEPSVPDMITPKPVRKYRRHRGPAEQAVRQQLVGQRELSL